MTERPRRPQRRKAAPPPRTAMLRRGALRIPGDIATRVRSGHPWVFRDALGSRLPPSEPAGAVLDVLDATGAFLGRALFDPDSAIALRLFTRRAGQALDRAYLLECLTTARKRRQALPDLAGVTALRLFAGESEGFPGVSVDQYGDFLVVQFVTEAALHFREPLYDALEQLVHPTAIYEQRRLRPLSGEGTRGPAELVRGTLAPLEIEVAEGAARFLVDVTSPQNVGLFADLRLGRQLVGRLASGRRVVNLFSYTGAFSVHAALGGASEIVSVDLAAKSHARARRNLELSGQDPERGKEYLADDAFKALARLASRGRTFDLVICDPPSFSQAKGRVFTALRDWAELVAGALAVLPAGGLFLACSNTAKLAQVDLERALGEGAARAGANLLVLARLGLPVDFPVAAGFPEGHYLKCVLAAKA